MAFTVRTPRYWFAAAKGERSTTLTVDQYLMQMQEYFRYGGNLYGVGGAMPTTMPGRPQEEIANNFLGFVRGAYKANGVVFACILARMSLFSEARFQWRRLREGSPGDLFGSPGLRKLERPWAGATTRDLLGRMEQDASLSGNSFVLDLGMRLKRLRPDWTNIVMAGDREEIENPAEDPTVEIVGYSYTPGGMYSGREPIVYRADQVAHYAPIPDPEAEFRGMSWITPIALDIMGDKAASEHKLNFFEGGGTPNMTVEYNPEFVKDNAAFESWVEAIEEQVASFAPGHRRLHLGGGTKATVVGSNLEEAQFKAVQGAGETRICMDAGVPPIVIGASEGLEAATYSNYGQARRAFADGTMRNLWGHACGSLETIMAREMRALPPGGRETIDVELWYADRHIAFLQDDQKDAAEVQNKEATTIGYLTDRGFKPETAIAAVVNDDWNMLEYDPEMAPVQTRPATGGGRVPAETNGSGDAAAIAQPEEG